MPALTVDRILVALKAMADRNFNSHCKQNFLSFERYCQQECHTNYGQDFGSSHSYAGNTLRKSNVTLEKHFRNLHKLLSPTVDDRYFLHLNYVSLTNVNVRYILRCFNFISPSN